MVLLFDDDAMHLLSFPSFLIDLDLEFSTGQYVPKKEETSIMELPYIGQ